MTNLVTLSFLGALAFAVFGVGATGLVCTAYLVGWADGAEP